MIIDVSSTDVVKIYRTLVEVVTPRPIAWVTTIDAEGRVNPCRSCEMVLHCTECLSN